MTLEERFAAHARAWPVSIDEVRTTETSRLGFGTRGGRPVVLKVIRHESGEEWHCGEVLAAFHGAGVILPIEHEPGAVLLPRLVPGNDLVSLSLDGRDEEAVEVIASLIDRMSTNPASVGDAEPVIQIEPEFEQFRAGTRGLIPEHYIDYAHTLFGELCATQRNVRLLHGDLHHYNVLFDKNAGWMAIDPWGVMGETEFEVGASLRNPIDGPALLGQPCVMERRIRSFEVALNIDPDRALKWAFATTVLAILWPSDHVYGLRLRAPFAAAAQSMFRLLK